MNKLTLQVLKTNLELEKSLKQDLADKRESFEMLNAALIKDVKEISDRVNDVKEQVRKDALGEYEKTGEKKLLGGIGIRVLKELIYDEKEIILWAKTNMPLCVKEVLDKTTFNSFLKNNPDSVHNASVKEKPSVSFPKEIILGEEK